MMKHLSIFAMVAVILFTCIAKADDPAKVANPLYVAWAKTKVGSSASYAGDIESPDGKKIHFTGTLTLKEIKADGATVENVSTLGDDQPTSETLTIPAAGKRGDVTKKTDTTAHAMGKDFKCEQYVINFALAGAPDKDKPEGGTTATIDVSPDVPGGVVKMVVHPSGEKDFEVLLQSISDK